jgi:AbrB family looped-hinge helix DNA binding protein
MVVYMHRKEIIEMETYATIKGQIVIPASLRRKYGIKDGTKIIITDIGDAIVLKPVTEQYLKNLQGSLKGKGGLKVLLEERARDKEREK